EAFEHPLGEPSFDPASTRSIETGLVVLGLFEPQLIELTRARLRGFDPDGPLDDDSSRILISYGAYDDARSGAALAPTVERALRVLASGNVAAESQGASWAALVAVLWAADRLDDARRLAEQVTRAGEELGSVFLASSGLVMQ